MRVLWVFSYLSPQLQRVAEELTGRFGVELEIMCEWDEERPLAHCVPQMTRITCKRKIDLPAQRAIRQKLRSGRYDIVHAYTSRNFSNLICASRGLRPIPKIIGYRGTINPLLWNDLINYITFWHPRTAKILCVCEATNRALRESNVSPKKLATVWEGCDRSVLPSIPPRSQALAEFNIPDHAFVVGAVANMRPVKGLDLLLRAAQELTDLSDMHLLLIGDVRDPQIAEMASDPRIAERTHLVGPRPVGGRYTGLMDVYAAPSRMEGLSMSIMEAMSQAISVVVSDVGGNTELIRDQVDGLVVPSENPSALAAAIRRLHASVGLRHDLAASAQRRVEQLFSVPLWTRRLYAVYHELAEGVKLQRAA